MPLVPGSRLGPYEIVAPLGAGGMGEVYRARDTRLGREVAVKVLPPRLAATPEARARFEREARTISQLSHPHICTLHDIGHEAGVDYLVLELLEGETLADRVARGPLPLAELLALGTQVAGALQRAHRAGVIHRDLKPGNVMLTATGAKLLDFGLARPAAVLAPESDSSQSPTMMQPLTAEGALVGTFRYMAPEQLEGRDADTRTDIWGLGCLLYEMATGTPAFSGDSQASLIAAVMTGQPRAVSELREVTPVGLDRLIRWCLEKRPEARPQAAMDVAYMLELAAVSLPPSTAPRAPAPSRRRPQRTLMAVLAVFLLAAGFLAGRWTAPRTLLGSLRVSVLSQGTRDYDPAVSPDGRLIAFYAVRQNGQGLWLMDMVSRSEVKLTDGEDRLPRFAADGGSILFTRIVEGQPSLWRVPVIGGGPRLVLEGASDAAPAPDGRSIAFITGDQDSSGVVSRLMVAGNDGTAPREVWSNGHNVLAGPRWSPDGRTIALFKGGTQNSPSSLVVVDVASRSARQFPAPNGWVLSTAAWDGSGKGLIVAEGTGITAIQRGAPGQLFRLDTRSGRYQPLGWLENYPSTLDLLPDGRLVLSSVVGRQSLVEVPVGAHDLSSGRWLTSGLAIDRQPVYSPDGAAVAFSSNRGGTLDLWELTRRTGEMHRVTDDPADDWDPEFSRDGEQLLWCSSRSGPFEIWTARRDGSAPRQVSRDSVDAENPSVAPDGTWLLYSSAHPRKSGVWRVPVGGGEGEQLLRTGSLIPDLSPDGRYFSVVTEVGTNQPSLRVYDLQERRLLPRSIVLQVLTSGVQNGRSRITPDGRRVAYLITRSDGQTALLRRPIEYWRSGAGAADTLFAGARATIESFDFSPDGRQAVLSVIDWFSSLTVAEGVPGIVPPKPLR